MTATTGFPLGAQLDAIPIVLSPADRAIRFPSPNLNQRTYTISTLSIDRWTGAAWVQDFLSTSGSSPITVGGLLTASDGLVVTAPNPGGGFPAFVTLNGLRAVGGNVGVAMWGQNATGAQDTYWYNDGSGNTYLSQNGVNVLLIAAGGGQIQQLQPGNYFLPQIGGHACSDGWYLTNPAASLTNSLMNYKSPVVALSTVGSGLLTGVAVKSSAAITGANGTVTVYKNGVATTLTATITVGQTFGQTQNRPPSGPTVPYTNGDLLDVRLTTPSGWTFTTGTVQAVIEYLT